jgi:hypothetical protein
MLPPEAADGKEQLGIDAAAGGKGRSGMVVAAGRGPMSQYYPQPAEHVTAEEVQESRLWVTRKDVCCGPGDN